ncbi:YdcF family protein [Staphylococcus caeli]|uniref:YdcF family protein n=1 Tax=Staphylococcus caeli TaxID=2201815 RepID=UPI003F57C629
MLSLFLCTLILVIYLCMFFNFKYTARLAVYISQVILGFISIILHIGNHTFPFDLIVVMCIGVILLHIKHKHLMQTRLSALFLKRLYYVAFKLMVFTLACFYITFSPLAINVIFLWISAIAFSAAFAFICYLSCSSNFSKNNPATDFDIILVLGAGIFTEQVTPMLADRLDRAFALYNQQPNAYMLVSGGQGPDEPISEALAMQRYLISLGVNPNQILLEDQSTSTLENMQYSAQLLKQHFATPPKIVCVTSQFHIMRAIRFGQKFNLNLAGIGSHTPYHFFEIALIRDFLALMYQYKALLTVYFATLFCICIIAFWHIPSI